MTCDERKDLLLLYAGDMLDPAEREALRAHLLTGCPACSGALAEAEATLAQMALAVDPIAPPAAALDKLMARIDPAKPSSAQNADRSNLRIEPRRRAWFIPSLAAAAAAVLITSIAWLYVTRDARSFWHSKNLAAVTLTSPTQPNATGQVLWDRDHHEWRVTVAQLGPTEAGREYELWVIPTGSKPIRSKSFSVAGDGSSTFVVPVPPDVTQLATAAITDEPIGGTDAPTGKIHLAGEFH